MNLRPMIKIPKPLLAKGVEAFGTEKLFKAWLNQTNIALGDRKPMELLVSKKGILQVEDLIEAMNYGNAV